MRIFCAQPLQEVQYDWLFSRLGALERHGHQFVPSAHEAEVVFFENRVGHTPYDDHNLNAAVANRLPVVVFDNLEYHSAGDKLISLWFSWYERRFENVVADRWSFWMHRFFWHGMVNVYFLKYMQASRQFPPWVFPIDYAYRPEQEQPEETREQFKNRPYDVCLHGHSSQPKATSICHFIESRRLKVSWGWYQPVRIPWIDWMNKYRQSKFFLESEGWGPSNKPMELAWVAPMLRQNADYRYVNDWTDGKNCVLFGDLFGVPSEADIDNIEGWCSRPDALYDIYRAGREFMRANYTEQNRADYINGVITRHL